MTWKQEIFRALFLAFGTGEIIANLNYLIKKNGIDLARRQHQELPANASDKQMRIKVICMLSAGIMFFIESLISYITRSYSGVIIIGSLIAVAIYACVEALYYKYWKTAGFAIVSMILLGSYVFL